MNASGRRNRMYRTRFGCWAKLGRPIFGRRSAEKTATLLARKMAKERELKARGVKVK